MAASLAVVAGNRFRKKAAPCHLIAETTLGGTQRTWCGNVRVGRMMVAEREREITCENCIAAIQKAAKLSSERRSRLRLEMERLSKGAYDAYQHRAGHEPSVPFESLSMRERSGWMEVAEYFVEESKRHGGQ